MSTLQSNFSDEKFRSNNNVIAKLNQISHEWDQAKRTYDAETMALILPLMQCSDMVLQLQAMNANGALAPPGQLEYNLARADGIQQQVLASARSWVSRVTRDFEKVKELAIKLGCFPVPTGQANRMQPQHAHYEAHNVASHAPGEQSRKPTRDNAPTRPNSSIGNAPTRPNSSMGRH